MIEFFKAILICSSLSTTPVIPNHLAIKYDLAHCESPFVETRKELENKFRIISVKEEFFKLPVQESDSFDTYSGVFFTSANSNIQEDK